MKMDHLQSQMASNLIQTVVGQAQNKQTDLALKMAKVALSQNLQSPNTSSASGQGSLVDVVG